MTTTQPAPAPYCVSISMRACLHECNWIYSTLPAPGLGRPVV